MENYAPHTTEWCVPEKFPRRFDIFCVRCKIDTGICFSHHAAMSCVTSSPSVYRAAIRDLCCPYQADDVRLEALDRAHLAFDDLEKQAAAQAYQLIRCFAAATEPLMLVAADSSEPAPVRQAALCAVGSGFMQIDAALQRLTSRPAATPQEDFVVASEAVALRMTACAEIPYPQIGRDLLGILRDTPEDEELCNSGFGILKFAAAVGGDKVDTPALRRDLESLRDVKPRFGLPAPARLYGLIDSWLSNGPGGTG